jgi:hypothetical protein
MVSLDPRSGDLQADYLARAVALTVPPGETRDLTSADAGVDATDVAKQD